MRNTEVKTAIHVVAGIIRHPKNPSRIFFTQRKKGQHLEDLWEFPGGKVEAGESGFHALRRELEEETGIFVHSALPFHSLTHNYHDKKIFLDVWEVKLYSGYAHGKEGQQSKWLGLNDFDEYPFPDADLPVLKALSLPSKLLITPDIFESSLERSLLHFYNLMKTHPYELVLFRSDQLVDKSYFEIASELKHISDKSNAEIIISRPDLDSLKSRSSDPFKRRHLNSQLLRTTFSSPFDESISLSSSSRDKLELEKSEKLNCDFSLLSAVKQTATYAGRPVHGWYQFRKMTMQSRIPIFALGGVEQKDLAGARFQGAVGVAGTSKFW